MDPKRQWSDLKAALVAPSEQAHGPDAAAGAKRMFASTSMKTSGKMFAFLQRKQRLVVKLPELRVNELIAAGAGERYDPGDGRLQREWVVVTANESHVWLKLATEAEAYVANR